MPFDHPKARLSPAKNQLMVIEYRRDEVVRGDVPRFDDILSALIESRQALGYGEGARVFHFSGWNSDPRDITDIREIRRWIVRLTEMLQSVPEAGPHNVRRWGRVNLRRVWCSQSGQCCPLIRFLSIGVIRITSIVLMRQNRQHTDADIRAELPSDSRLVECSGHNVPRGMIGSDPVIGDTFQHSCIQRLRVHRCQSIRQYDSPLSPFSHWDSFLRPVSRNPPYRKRRKLVSVRMRPLHPSSSGKHFGRQNRKRYPVYPLM